MSKRTTQHVLTIGMLVVLGLLLAACSGPTQVSQATPGPVATQPPAPTCPAPEPCPTAEPVEQGIKAPFEEEWAASPHNNASSPAFTYWDKSEDKSIPVACATCHSSTGFIDFVGGDGSEVGKVDAPAPIGTTVTCDACHNPAAAALTAVTFPSGAVISDLGSEARCMVCHQGRSSKVQVEAQIERFSAEDPDAVVAPIKDGDRDVRFGFINIHYYAAAATLYGTEAKGGYEYPGKLYDARFEHVADYDSCVGCHNPHTLEVKVEECAACHQGVQTVEDLQQVRMVSSSSDYDGDGNNTEGLGEEISGLRDYLYGGMLIYAKDVAGLGLVYDKEAHPYFFADTDADGKADTNDTGARVAYTSWTPRLLKAAYNYQVSLKDPGNYAHGNKYIIQLLYDSIEDLNAGLPTPIDMSQMHRDDPGHFAGNTAAFRYWDGNGGLVPATCAKCHTATGLPEFLKEGVNITNHASNGLLCVSCHSEENWPAVYAVNEVTFPSGAKLTFGEANANNICLMCHQGRSSGPTVDRALGTKALDEVDPNIRFLNVHYFAAGATLFGSEAQGIYEYAGKEYAGRYVHPGFDTCASCHDPHALQPKVQTCAGCHGSADPATYRMKLTADYDGDGDTTEGVKGEIDTMTELLYEAILAYAADTAGTGILYDSHAHPYFFADADGDGKADMGERGRVAYATWTPRLLKAAYNYQYAQKDPGAFAHNAVYTMQALYDSIDDLGGSVTGLTRP
jgi:hypothetical protein